MGFRTGAYAKVWSIDAKSDTNTSLRISISKKNKQTGEYENDFAGFVNCYGTAVATQAARLKEGDRIKLGDVDVGNKYDKEKNKEYVYYKVFSFEMADGSGNASTATAHAPAVDSVEIDDSGLPF